MCRQPRQGFRQASKTFCIVVLIVICQGWSHVGPSWADLPAVVSAAPANGSSDADPNLSAISFTFSVPMDRGTFAISQTGPYLIMDFVEATWSGDARNLTLPRSGNQGPLPEGARVTLILNPQGSSNPFKDQAGNILPTYTYTFSVVVTDNSPPTIVGTGPPAIEFGGTTVSRDLTEISISFNRAMNPLHKSVSTGNWLYAYTGIYWSADGKTLHVARTDTDYGLWPSSEIKFYINLAGHEDIQDYQGRFVEETTLSWKVESIDVSDSTEFQKPAADSAKGYYWPYYLYIPRTVADSAVLLVEPNNTGHSDEDWSVHDQAAGGLLNYRSVLADVLESPLLVPTFPRPGHIYTHALERNCLLTQEEGLERIDLQLIAMIDDARQRLAALGIRVGPRVDMMGFSASGSFTANFTALHPDRIRAAAIGAPGGWPIAPVATWLEHDMTYSLGISDLQALTGNSFDLETFKHLPLYFYLGDKDDNWDSQDVSTDYHFLGKTYQERWPVAEQIYNSVGCNSQFVMYANVGHSITPAMTDDVRDFFLNHSPLEVEDFVTRFYQQCLSREPEDAGLDYWTTSLLFGTRTGAEVAKGFIFSPEFLNRNVDDDAYLKVLYKAFFDRDPDSGGYDYWFTKLRSGESRNNILDGFIYAQEFANLCDSFNILPFRDRTPVIAFVTRFYQQCLNREPEAAGLDYWVNSLLDGSRTGADVAGGFVFSQEFINRNVDNHTYLVILYRAFFNRDPDSGGYTYWLDKLNRQESRESVLNGFLGAQEFFNLCDRYGIIAQ